MDFYFHPVHVWRWLIDFAATLATKETLFLAAAYGWACTLPLAMGEDYELPYLARIILHAVCFAAIVTYPTALWHESEFEVGDRRAGEDSGSSERNDDQRLAA